MTEERQFQIEPKTGHRLQVNIGDLSVLSFHGGPIEIWIDGRKAERVRSFELSGGVDRVVLLKLTLVVDPARRGER